MRHSIQLPRPMTSVSRAWGPQNPGDLHYKDVGSTNANTTDHGVPISTDFEEQRVVTNALDPEFIIGIVHTRSCIGLEAQGSGLQTVRHSAPPKFS